MGSENQEGTVRNYTVEEKLAEVERLIEVNRGNDVLREVARDLRGRLLTAPSVAIVMLERRLNAVKARSVPAVGSGFRMSEALSGAGEELVARWPTIRQALERFGNQLEQETAS